MKPSIGRIVLYQYGGQVLPAIVVEVRDDGLTLTVFTPMPFAAHRVREGTEPGTWRWPERV